MQLVLISTHATLQDETWRKSKLSNLWRRYHFNGRGTEEERKRQRTNDGAETKGFLREGKRELIKLLRGESSSLAL